MSVGNIALVWAEPATDPRSSFQPQYPYPNFRDAIRDAQSAVVRAQHPGRVPWLRAGTGFGAQAVNEAGIEMLREAFNEAVGHGQTI